MKEKNFDKILFAFAFVIIIVLFSYFRLRPIYYQTVPYTFDQGRDFLKAAEIVREKNLTFIGPTTGVMGVFHGAWWYYFLVFPYLLFSGWPQGFYLAVLFIHLATTILFACFLKKEFNNFLALLFLLIVSVSPYFIKISVFPSNTTLSPVAILFFIYALYSFFKRKNRLNLFLLGLSLSFLAESELTYVIYFAPACAISGLFFSDLRKISAGLKNLSIFFLGLIIPFLPRILFELKNNFAQTKALINFLKHPTATNVISLQASFSDRIHLLTKYFVEIFYNYYSLLALVFFLISAASIIFLSKKLLSCQKKTFIFLSSSILLLLLFITLSKNNFFWDNYLEGFHYFFLFLIIISLYPLTKTARTRSIIFVLTAGYFIINLYHLKLFVTDKNKPPSIGLRADMEIIKYIYQVNKNKDFCLRIYTPPVIPHTYNYLLNYLHQTKKYLLPKLGYVNNRCWYIFDYEPYVFRVVQWRKDHTPAEAELVKSVFMPNKTQLELWQINDKQQ